MIMCSYLHLYLALSVLVTLTRTCEDLLAGLLLTWYTRWSSLLISWCWLGNMQAVQDAIYFLRFHFHLNSICEKSLTCLSTYQQCTNMCMCRESVCVCVCVCVFVCVCVCARTRTSAHMHRYDGYSSWKTYICLYQGKDFHKISLLAIHFITLIWQQFNSFVYVGITI